MTATQQKALAARIEAVDAFAAQKRKGGLTVAAERAIGRAEGLREARDLFLADDTATRTAEAERADVVRFLREEAVKFDRGSYEKSLPAEGRARCRAKAAELRTVTAYIERGDHVTGEAQPVALTPEVVLRAMLKAYGDAEVDAVVEAKRAPFSHGSRETWLYACRVEMLSEVAHRGCGGNARPFCQPRLQADYEARLSGVRSLNAPPLEVS